MSSTEVAIVFDPGSSLTKVLYFFPKALDRGLQYITLGSECFPLPSSQNLPVSCGLGKIENHCWVKLKKKDSNCLLVGHLATQYRAGKTIKKLKYESMIPKILSVFGVICSREEIDSLDVFLVSLIPFSEHENRKQLISELKKTSKNFLFLDKQIKVNIKEHSCFVEGYGLVNEIFHKMAKKEWQKNTKVFLMFGYRNTTVLIFNEGSISKKDSNTTLLGFYDFLDKFAAKVAGLTREEIQDAIVTTKTEIFNKNKGCFEDSYSTEILLEKLIKSRDPQRVENELTLLKEAYKSAMAEYWQLLECWLIESLDGELVNTIYYSGGVSDFFKEKIDDFCKERAYSSLLIRTNSNLTKVLSLDKYDTEYFNTNNLGLRFADAWGILQPFYDQSLEAQTEEKEALKV